MKFSRQHFALYRGYLDGLTDAQLHRSYGEAGTDMRITRRTIATLRDALTVAARRARDTPPTSAKDRETRQTELRMIDEPPFGLLYASQAPRSPGSSCRRTWRGLRPDP